MNKNIIAREYFTSLKNVLDKFDRDKLIAFAEVIALTSHNDRTVYVFGNGGSGANASHFCGDLLKGVAYECNKNLRVICLNDNNPTVLALANDISYAEIFVQQLKMMLKPGDLVIGISGSGNSSNIVKALDYAKEITTTVALCGYDGGLIKGIADISLHVDINDMEISEDIHLILFHCTKRILQQMVKEG